MSQSHEIENNDQSQEIQSVDQTQNEQIPNEEDSNNESKIKFIKNVKNSYTLTRKTAALISIYPDLENLNKFINDPPIPNNCKFDITHILPIMSYLYQIDILIDAIEKKAIKNGIFFNHEVASKFKDRIEPLYKDINIDNFVEDDLTEFEKKTNFINQDDFLLKFTDENLRNDIQSIKIKVNLMKESIKGINNISKIESNNITSILTIIKEIKDINNEIESVIKQKDNINIKEYNEYTKYLTFITERIISLNIINTNYRLCLDICGKIEAIDKYAENFHQNISNYLKELDETQIYADPWPIITIINAIYLTEPEYQYDDERLLIYDCSIKLYPFDPKYEKRITFYQIKECLQEEFSRHNIYQIISIIKKADIHYKPYNQFEIKSIYKLTQ